MTSPNAQIETSHAARAQAGAMLRTAREGAGKSASELATQLKVSPDKIMAIEAGDWERLPDLAFARGLLRAASKALKADTDAIMQLLPPAHATPVYPDLTAVPGRPLPVARVASAQGPRNVWWLAVAGIVFAALLVFFLPHAENWSKWLSDLSTNTSRPATTAAVQTTPSSGISTSLATVSAHAPQLSGSAAKSEPSVQAVAAPGMPASLASTPATAATLSIAAAGASWVRVTGAQGRKLFSGIVPAAGVQTLALSAQDLPLQLVVGNASQTQVSFGGQAVDLTPSTNNNVARLTLPKP
jgi:cytoskeleton protein RodZ